MKFKPIPRHWRDRIAEDPNSDFAKKALSTQNKINALNAVEEKTTVLPRVSSIGNRLKSIFEDNTGVLPCGACKTIILQLNGMTVDKVLTDKDKITEKIFKNLKQVKLTFIQDLAVKLDIKLTGGAATKFLISMWIEEACNDERKESVESTNLDNNHITVDMDRATQ
jgi:hypothetical protein